jgi:hypothetical protein
MVLKHLKKWSVVPAACVSLAWFATGCSNSSTNESGSTGATGTATAAPTKDAPPPPKDMKEWAQREGKRSGPAGKAAP